MMVVKETINLIQQYVIVIIYKKAITFRKIKNHTKNK